MKCYTHRDREGVGVCVRCGKAVCEECRHERRGRTLCADCLARVRGRVFTFCCGIPNVEAIFEEVVGEVFGRHCPQCRQPVRAEYLVCPHCATRLKQTCSSCSKELRPEWKACPYCGTAVGTVTA